MIRLILTFIYFQFAFLSRNSYEKDQLLKMFIAEGNNDANIESWALNRSKIVPEILSLFKETLTKVLDILSELHKKFDFDIVYHLILKTNMKIKNLGNPYYETFVILRSLKRVLGLNYMQNEYRNRTHKMLRFKEDVLFKEYNKIYIDLKKVIIHLGLEFNKEVTEKYREKCKVCRNCNIYYIEAIILNLPIIKKLFYRINNMIEAILPVKKSEEVEVNASFLGFNGSKRFSGRICVKFFRKQYTPILPENMLQYRIKSSAEQSLHTQIDLKDFMDVIYVCNLALVKFLISLFHFYSETRERTTIYEIRAKGNNRFKIAWSMPLKQPKDKIKRNWLQQEIKNIPLEKIMPKFSLLDKNQVEYTLIRSGETEDNSIYTRLILLSCGHQLGFELIDEFLENYIRKNTKLSICHICKIPIWIMGSYDAIVYRCN
jgi:hypothetical protein